MPRGVYIRTEECNKAHRVPKPGSGIYERKPEHIARLVAMGFKKGNKPNFTPEWREKIRVALTGANNPLYKKPMPDEQRKKLIGCHKPWHHRPETIEKLSGSNCHLWKGGITRNMKEYAKNYYAKNITRMREKSKIEGHNRRTKGGRLTREILQMVYEDNIKKFGKLTCYLCEKHISFGDDSLEHKTPLSRGGTNEYPNLAIAHLRCNISKHNKTEEEYRRKN